MKNLGRIAVVVAALLATYVGAKFAKEDAQKEINQANMGQVKESKWVRVDGNGNIIPSVDPATTRKADNIEKVKAAEWIKVEGNGDVTFYVDPATISKAGNKAIMLTLVDFRTANKSGDHPYMSMKTQHEYDCTENKWRLLNFSYHSGNMGGGELVHADAELGQWEPVKLGSGTQIRWKIACGKR